MRLRFVLVVCVLAAIGLLLLGASYAIAAPSSASPPSWAWAVAGCCIAGLVGLVGWLVKWIFEQRIEREKKNDARWDTLTTELTALKLAIGEIKSDIKHLPCRTPKNGVPPPPSALCSLHDRDVEP